MKKPALDGTAKKKGVTADDVDQDELKLGIKTDHGGVGRVGGTRLQSSFAGWEGA